MSGVLVYWVPDGSNKMKSLRLTVCSREDRGGVAAVRRRRLSRLLREAALQGARLSYRDLGMIMLVSKATLKRDIGYLKRSGIKLPDKVQ